MELQSGMYMGISINAWASYQIRKFAGCACAGNAGTFFAPPQVSDPSMHHGTCVTHVPWCMLESLTRSFSWRRWRGKRSLHSQHMCIRQIYVSGNRPIPIESWFNRLIAWEIGFICSGRQLRPSKHSYMTTLRHAAVLRQQKKKISQIQDGRQTPSWITKKPTQRMIENHLFWTLGTFKQRFWKKINFLDFFSISSQFFI